MALQLTQLDEVETDEGISVASPGSLAHGYGLSRSHELQAGMLRWQIITDRAATMALTVEWSSLAERCPGSLFMTPEWVQSWLSTIGQEVEPRIITARLDNTEGRDNRLVVLWPLGLRSLHRGPVSIRLLEPMGETLASGDRLDPLVAADGIEKELIQQVRTLARSDCDLMHWGELRGEGPLVHALAQQGTTSISRTIHTRVLPLADLPGSYEEFTRRLGKKLRGHVRRQEQIALEQHGLCWKLNDEGTSLALAVQEFADLHQQCWRHRGKTGNLAESRFRAFIEQFAEAAHRRGWLRLHRLCSGERTVAALMAFHHNDRAYYYQSGWNPEVAKLSPGSLCVAHAVRMAIEEGLELFDFLRGDEAYKRRWANRQDETTTIAEAARLRGRALLTGRDVKEIVKHGIVSLGGSAAWERVKTHLLRQPQTIMPERGDG